MNPSDALPMMKVSGDSVLAKPIVTACSVKPDGPALNVMTDFLQTTPITVDAETPIDEALLHMIHAGVRLLFVTGPESRLTGLITSTDIQGEKPIRHMQAVECMDRTCSRRQVRVQDIMTPVASWEVLDYKTVCRATVARIVATFNDAGRRHLLVVERPGQSNQCRVRGLFSATRLEQQSGLTLNLVCTPKSFADVERVLAHPYGECD